MFEARYLVKRASLEKSNLALKKSEFCEERENGIKNPLLPTEKKAMDVFTFYFDDILCRRRGKFQK